MVDLMCISSIFKQRWHSKGLKLLVSAFKNVRNSVSKLNWEYKRRNDDSCGKIYSPYSLVV